MQDKTAILSPGSTYHIFNRANGSEKMFVEPENYRFFLQQYQLYVSPYVDTFCYCLMPNHFHLLIRVREEKEILTFLGAGAEEKTFPKFRTLEKLRAGAVTTEQLVSKAFSHFFSSYTQAFNKVYHRKGSLFIKNFKRIQVNDDLYLKKLVHYIHHNPVEANLCKQPQEWPYSSYSLILESKNTLINTHEVIEWFDNLENFKAFHQLSFTLTETE